MLNPRWRKVIRDLWTTKTRTALVVMAIAVGVFAFGSVFITNEVLITDMNAQYLAINASTITVSIPSFDDTLVRSVRRQKDVADAQGRATRLVKIINGDKTYNLLLVAFDDYEEITLNIIRSETGTWPPGSREILLERSSVSLSGAGIGDSIEIEMSNGFIHHLNLAGTVHDLNALPATLYPQLTGYVSMKTLVWLGFPGTYNQLEIAAREEFDTVAKLETVADGLRDRWERNGVSIDSILVRAPGEHWGIDPTRAFTLILNVMGVFALILSGFLVVNTMSALLAGQRRQIGMMKAVGGTGRQIMGIYVVLVTCYGLLALAVALPIGMVLGYFFTNAVMGFLNVDILNYHLPLRVFLLQVMAALLVPVLASAVPVFAGTRVTVREAVSDFGIGAAGGQGLLDRMLMRVRGLPRPVLLSLRNTFRRKGRLFLTLGTLVVAGMLFISVMNVRGALSADTDNILNMLFNYEVQLFLDGDYESRGVARRAESLAGVVRAEGRTGAQAQRIKADGSKGATFAIVGLPAGSDFIQPEMISGRWLKKNDRNAIVLSSNLAEDMPNVRVGDKIVLDIGDEKHDWEVAGVMLMAFDKVAYADFDYLSSVKGEPGLASMMFVRTEQKDGESQSEMAGALEDRLKEAGINVSQSATRDTLSSAWAGQFAFLIGFLMSMAAMTALIGALGLAGMMSLNVMERTREIGIMRSLGAADRTISGIVVTEGLLIGLMSWVLALPLSIPVTILLNAGIGSMVFDQPLVFTFSPVGVVIWLAIIVTVSVAASLLPAYRATRMSIRETLAYE